MSAVHTVAEATLPSMTAPTWLTLFVGLVTLGAVFVLQWLKKKSRLGVLTATASIVVAGALAAGALFVGVSHAQSTASPSSAVEEQDIQLPTLELDD